MGLVFYISARIQKLNASTPTGLFLLYSALNGATLSFIFLVYAGNSIASVFLVCAATFVACSIYGMSTKRDLTSLGGFMAMGLIGIIIASVVNIFLLNSAMNIIISYIGVFVFVGLTAYDTQKLKKLWSNPRRANSLTSVTLPTRTVQGRFTVLRIENHPLTTFIPLLNAPLNALVMRYRP